ncbi:triosephosphate isomerase [Weissella paramesenteroides]|uniref:Triosephosphate isomerase n=1 Tax=Weissella paramesenteroides TaxID=1249 RepID=A0ABD4XIH6_WEIPA|nr:triose-phosphate isomerase [Weissella paramesenteroides]MDF8368954.1 triosephosphate isomerase [Weissella paramesenteroides]MDF8370967.1 triosephosphate isomerase [Weissella paramesenteroides]
MLAVLNFKNLVDFEQQKQFLADLSQATVDVDLKIAPTLLVPNTYDNFEVVSQNLTIKQRTVGEISPSVLQSLGITTSFIGHLERRKSLNEGLLIVRKRLENALENNITPILSVGQYSNIDMVVEELGILLKDEPITKPIIIAYESLASTEMGRALYSIDEIRDIHDAIRKFMKTNYPEISYQLILGGHMDEAGSPIANAIGYDGVLIGDRYHTLAAFQPVLDVLNKLSR